MNLKAQCSYAGLSVLKLTDERVAGVRDFRKGTRTAHNGSRVSVQQMRAL